MITALDVTTLARVCSLADRILCATADEQLTDPTPCSEWNVQQVMEHVVGATDFFADVAELGSSPEGRNWPEYSPEDLVPAFRRHAERLLAAFGGDGAMGRSMLLPSGQTTGQAAIQVAIAELFIHSWDLATATHQPFGEGDVAEALLASGYMDICAQVRDDPSAPFAAAVPIPRGASAVDRLAAFLGRDPRFVLR